MYLKSIELINIRSYKKEKIKLSKGINLLLGQNNSGKSTIIRAAYVLQSKYSLNKTDTRRTIGWGKIFLELVDLQKSDWYLFFDKNNPKILPLTDKQTVLLSFSKRQEVTDQHLYHDGYLKTKRLEYDRVEVINKDGKEQALSDFPFFPDMENENNFIYPYLAKRKTDYYNTQVNFQETYRVSDNFRNLCAKIQKISNSSHPRNREFIDLCDEILGFRIGVIPGENQHDQDIGIFIKDGETISLKSMGDGVANILGLIVILLTENNKLFLIEELENDIHPDALKKLLNLIVRKSKSNQFIISTHSHIVLKYLGASTLCKIFYIQWKPQDEDNSQKKNIPTSIITEVKNTPEKRLEILEKLGYNFFDFELYPLYLILEESSAEQVIRDFLIPNLVPELYNKLKTISAKGVDDLEVRVQDFNRLFVFIHTNQIYYKKAWVLADGDSGGKKCVEKLQNTFNKWPKSHFINLNQSDFEYYYPNRFQGKVAITLNIQDKRKRNEAKNKLLQEVIKWSLNNREEAKKEFIESAHEIILILKKIVKKLSKA